MKFKQGLVIVFSLVLFIFSVLYYLGASGNIKNSPEELSEECESLVFNGESAINLLFFSDGGKTQEYSELIFNSKPFSDYENSFNIYYIDDYVPVCNLYKGIAILCYSSKLIRKASSCPHDFIFVIKEDKEEIRSSSYINVMSLNSNHPKTVILHEFGHALGNLAEEYINDQNPHRGSKNCVNECYEFNDLEEGCFEGCSKSEFIRSSENGVMRTLLSNKYGTYNEFLLTNAIESYVEPTTSISGSTIFDESDCLNERHFFIEIKKNSNGFFVLNQSIELGCSSRSQPEGLYSYKIYSSNNEILEGRFNPQIFTDFQDSGSEELDGEIISLDEVEFILTFPYNPSYTKFSVFDENNEGITENLISFGGNIACYIE